MSHRLNEFFDAQAELESLKDRIIRDVGAIVQRKQRISELENDLSGVDSMIVTFSQ